VVDINIYLRWKYDDGNGLKSSESPQKIEIKPVFCKVLVSFLFAWRSKADVVANCVSLECGV